MGEKEVESETDLDVLIAKTARLYARSITDQTRKDYVRRWKKWAAWCEARGLDPLGERPEAVMLFLADHIGPDGAALATLRSYVAAINRVHVEAGLAPPGDDPAMTMFLRTMKRIVVPSAAQEEISALKIAPLREVCRYLDSFECDPVEVRDRALLAMTRSGVGDGEQVRLRWTDISFGRDSLRLRLASVRRDREDRVVRIRRSEDPRLCGYNAILAWHAIAAESAPWVITKTDATGGRENRQWTPRDIYRIRRARLESLVGTYDRTRIDDAIGLLGGVPASVLRDKAMLLVGFAGAFRRPDLVGFRWSDVQVKDSGIILRLRKSKTDRAGRGADVGIKRGQSPTTDPVDALLAWRERVAMQLGSEVAEDGFCFTRVGRAGRIGSEPLTTTAVTVMIRTRLQEAGIEGRWSGRSLRRGFISQAADLGIRLEDIARGSRHATLDSLIRYIETDDPFRRNTAAQLGL
jgi:integrase